MDPDRAQLLEVYVFLASSTGCLPCESNKHPVLTIFSEWKVIPAGAGCQQKKKKMTNTLNRFFLLHEAVICYSLCPVGVPSIFVHLHWHDGSDLHIFFIYSPPRSCVQNRFPNQFCILGEQLSSASNENKCGMLNLNGRQVFSLHIQASNCQEQYAFLSVRLQCKFVSGLFWGMWPRMWHNFFIKTNSLFSNEGPSSASRNTLSCDWRRTNLKSNLWLGYRDTYIKKTIFRILKHSV